MFFCTLFFVLGFKLRPGGEQITRKDSPGRFQRRSENVAISRFENAVFFPFVFFNSFNSNLFLRIWGRCPETGSVLPNGPLCIPPVAPRHRASLWDGFGQSSRDECPQ